MIKDLARTMTCPPKTKNRSYFVRLSPNYDRDPCAVNRSHFQTPEWANRFEPKSANISRRKAKTLTLTNRNVYATAEGEHLLIKQAFMIRQQLPIADFMTI